MASKNESDSSKKIVIRVRKEPMAVRMVRIAIEVGINPATIWDMSLIEFAKRVGEARERRGGLS